ncbi:MAG TPA: fused MFS/spermidine synthase, partial [Actinomycetota bacterium]|nr:fused MFS/spermidine synthase [Actinomycetota bacterium]
DGPCLRESNYFCIQIRDTVYAGEPAKALVLDKLVHGLVDPDDPARPIYDYQLLYREQLTASVTPGEELDAFLIGGGTYTFPRYLERAYRGRVLVSEIDPAVTDVARQHLGLSERSRIEIVHEDARQVVERFAADERFDLVIGDAFNDAAVPFHLTTKEFNDLIAAHLSPGGMYMVNLIDGVDYDFLRAYVKTLQLTFPSVRLLTLEGGWPLDGTPQTLVVVAGDRPPPVVPSAVDPEGLRHLLDSRPAPVLTDEHVPVDQLLAGVFERRFRDAA